MRSLIADNHAMKPLLLALLLVPALASAEYFEIRKVVEAGAGVKVVKSAKTGEEFPVSDEVIVSDKHVATAQAAPSTARGAEETNYSLSVELSQEGAKRLSAATPAESAGKLRLVVLIEGKVVTAPVVRSAPLGKNFEITLSSAEEAQAVAKQLEPKKQ